ncbi:imidazoleglycerol-phosphate dehydratase HisB [Collinsella sp. An2]|uniref:imidazoleglycerol-phosphate dehydratase HisB n=1 Tax=Collinsella sp. An2 TaxID=1965585 RepID=UPI000B3A9C6D|nr:imidazoleglycerol-phosphate dehydratase HisB [Collinsella sp. An2]OUP06407.1 imidazoleglycerol-phosphate dehydratase [Collinsella sp. An2]
MTIYKKSTAVKAAEEAVAAAAEAGTAPRVVTVQRTTGETDITLTVNLDGVGACDINTGVPFFDHMLNAFGRHGLFDLHIEALGDTEVDAHHTVEDTGIVLGQAFAQALGDKRGVTRFADCTVPLDEALVQAVVDLSGRGQAYCDLPLPTPRVGDFDTELAVEFFYAFARDARLTLHVRELAGANSHHIIEAAFKAAGRAMRSACEPDARVVGIPSTKGSL